ncbi:lactate utilization protein [Microbulbifer sp. Q7]|uniref:LutC/YkgG family protein n=1 Tax=Microbulbifer sp. Q7 TaxID=1785091 RepID=UPI000AD82DC3|nr:lactate utilization protein [Microbulbifer sp. Q7]
MATAQVASLRTAFVQNLTANHAQVIETSEQQLAANVANTLASLGVTQLMGSAEARARLAQGDDTSIEWREWPEGGDDAETKAHLFSQVPAAISTAAAGIAQTGSLVLIPGPTEPRSLSLVPPTHLVIIQGEDLQPDLETWMAIKPWGDAMPTNIVLVSGPSKTADIQQTLAYGAHGPSRLVVFLVA